MTISESWGEKQHVFVSYLKLETPSIEYVTKVLVCISLVRRELFVLEYLNVFGVNKVTSISKQGI